MAETQSLSDDDSSFNLMDNDLFNEVYGEDQEVKQIREYQQEIFEKCRGKNSIIYLDTGTGKTFIAMMLAYHYLDLSRKMNKPQKIVVLANTVQLVRQQAQQFKKDVNKIGELMDYKYVSWYRSKEVKFVVQEIHSHLVEDEVHSKEFFARFYPNIDIMVLTPQILLNWLRRGKIILDELSLIIFDECHHANEDHPYNQIMKEFYFEVKEMKRRDDKCDELTKILGLTASPLIDFSEQRELKREKIIFPLIQICKNLDSNFVSYDHEKVEKYVFSSTNEVHGYPNFDKLEEEDLRITENNYNPNGVTDFMNSLDEGFSSIREIFNDFNQKFNESIYKPTILENERLKLLYEEVRKFLSVHSLRIIYELGISAYYDFFRTCANPSEMIEENEGRKEVAPPKSKKSEIAKYFENMLQELYQKYNIAQKFDANGNLLITQYSPKYEKLLNILKDFAKEVNTDDQMNHPQIIIFVERRFIASNMDKLIQSTLDSEEEKDNDLKYKISGGYVIGCTSSDTQVKKCKEIRADKYADYKDFDMQTGDIIKFIEKNIRINALPIQSIYNKRFTEITYNMDHQIDIINRFREKKLNLLIATSVAEEGFDIPNCNLVIAYNNITNLNSYIQIKGRARKKNSRFLLLVPEDEKQKMEKKLRYYEGIIQKMKLYVSEISKEESAEIYLERNRHLFERRPPSEREEFYKKVKIKHGKENPERVSLLNTNWSVSLLSSYCNAQRRIFRGLQEKKGHHFDEKEITNKPIFIVKEMNQFGYVVHIVLAVKNNVRFFVVRSNVTRTKIDAKRHAAFELIKHLYKKEKSFNPDLTVRNTVIEEDIIDEKIDEFINQQLESGVNMKLREKIQNRIIKKEKLKYYYFFTKEAFLSDFLSKPEKHTYYFYSLEIKTPQNKNLLDFSSSKYKLGFLHYRQNLKEEIHKGKLFIEPETQVRMEVRYLTSCPTIKQDVFDKLRKIDAFLWTAIRDEDLKFYDIETQNLIDPEGYFKGCYRSKAKVAKHFPTEFDGNNDYLMLLILTNDMPPTIDMQKIDEILNYIEKMKDKYIYYNSLKAVKEKGQSYIKPSLDLQIRDLFRSDPSFAQENDIILQSVTTFQKSLIKKEFKAEDMMTIEKRPGERISAKDRKKHLENSFDIKIDNSDHILKTMMISKCSDNYLKINILNTSAKYVLKEKDYKKNLSFSCEFVEFPLEFSFMLQLFFINKYFMVLLRDFIKTCRLKAKFFKMLSSKIPEVLNPAKDLNEKIIEKFSYKLNLKENYLLKNLLGLQDLIEKNPQIIENKKFLKFKTKKIGHNTSIIMNNDDYPSAPIDFASLNTSFNIFITLLRSSMMTRNYNIEDNYEKLEFFGDTILKALSTIQVFCFFPEGDEGFLHVERNKIISNNFLCSQTIILQIFKYILNDKLNFVPPAYILEEQNLVYHDPKVNFRNKEKKEDFKIPENYTNIGNKTQADVIEALTGVIFLSNDKSFEHCQYFLYVLGILKNPIFKLNLQIEGRLTENIDIPVKFYNFQKKIGYFFKDQGLLVQAFSHISIKKLLEIYEFRNDPMKKKIFETINVKKIENEVEKQFISLEKEINHLEKKNDEVFEYEEFRRFRNNEVSYERLEFLGDAIIDLVVNEYLFYTPEDSPGTLTFMKQSVVNNMALSLVALHFDFDELVLTNDPYFLNKIAEIKEKWDFYYENMDKYYELDSPYIKILGDLFEAFVGALFIDTNFDFYIARKILNQMLYDKFLTVFSSTEYLEKLPEMKMRNMLKEKGIVNPRLVKRERKDLNGESEYVLLGDEDNTELCSVFAMNQKQAFNKICKHYL